MTVIIGKPQLISMTYLFTFLIENFTVKQGNFSADLVMGASKGDSSFDESYSEPFSAKDEFDFRNAHKELKLIQIFMGNRLNFFIPKLNYLS